MNGPSEMELVIAADGVTRCIYDETLDQREPGKLQITRASHVEPDTEGNWGRIWSRPRDRCLGLSEAGRRRWRRRGSG